MAAVNGTINERTASGGISDLLMSNWKALVGNGEKDEDIITDSLWTLGDRSKMGVHDGFYHGNFIPQIPYQLIRRYTSAGGVVLDAFLGSGTTMIEARRLGRSCIGVELQREVAKNAEKLAKNQKIDSLSNKKAPACFSKSIVGDSSSDKTKQEVKKYLNEKGRENLDLIILHPPYHDIIQFSEHKNDLSNAESVEHFVSSFGKVVDNFLPMLHPKHYLAVVIGDKYTGGEWVPLGFHLMSEILRRNSMMLKSIVIKNMVNNRAKRNKENLWRYRALAGGFYVFRHEYILLFQKKNNK